jgi:hypothetical protein
MAGAATPSPKKDDFDADLDAVFEKIDAATTKIQQQTREVRTGDSPSSGFKVRNVRKTQETFVVLSEDLRDIAKITPVPKPRTHRHRLA